MMAAADAVDGKNAVVVLTVMVALAVVSGNYNSIQLQKRGMVSGTLCLSSFIKVDIILVW